MILLFRSLRVADCLDRALVLAAMGIDYQVRRTWWGWSLLVAAEDEGEARNQIGLYEQEQRVAPARIAAEPARAGTAFGLLAWLAVLGSLFVLQGNRGFGIDWTSAGRVDVAAVRAGEAWRVITALTLHRDFWHLLGNLGFGALFAFPLSRQLGPGVAWLAIVVAGASGNAINVLVQRPEHLSVGASTAVFAALGLLASVSFFFGAMHRETWARRWSPLVGGLWLLTWLGTGDARTDIVAHLTGFVAGLLLGGAAGWLAPTAGRDRPVQWAAGAATLLLIVAGWGAAFRQQLFG